MNNVHVSPLRIGWPRVTDEIKEEIVLLRNDGLTYRAITARLWTIHKVKVSTFTVHNVLRGEQK